MFSKNKKIEIKSNEDVEKLTELSKTNDYLDIFIYNDILLSNKNITKIFFIL